MREMSLAGMDISEMLSNPRLDRLLRSPANYTPSLSFDTRPCQSFSEPSDDVPAASDDDAVERALELAQKPRRKLPNQLIMGGAAGSGKSYWQKYTLIREAKTPSYSISCPCGETTEVGKVAKPGAKSFSDHGYDVVRTDPWVVRCLGCETERFGTTAESPPVVRRVEYGTVVKSVTVTIVLGRPVGIPDPTHSPPECACGTALDDEPVRTDALAPKAGWEYVACPDCGRTTPVESLLRG